MPVGRLLTTVGRHGGSAAGVSTTALAGVVDVTPTKRRNDSPPGVQVRFIKQFHKVCRITGVATFHDQEINLGNVLEALNSGVALGSIRLWDGGRPPGCC